MSHTGTSDAVAQAAGKITEALETVERARGHLYSVHQLTGHADLQLDAAVAELHELGHAELAQHISEELIGATCCRAGGAFRSSAITTTATTDASGSRTPGARRAHRRSSPRLRSAAQGMPPYVGASGPYRRPERGFGEALNTTPAPGAAC